METLTSIHCPSNYDEMSMHQSLFFGDSLEDLKNLRTQLYSAAEYFEVSYTNDDQKQIVVDTLKDYAVKALVNTVDHLGSVTYQVNDLLDEKVEEVSDTEFRVSCIEQRLRTCQEYMNREGMAQQSSVINTPRYHKQYVISAGKTVNSASLKDKSCGIDEDDWFQFRNTVRAMIKETPSFIRTSPAARPSQLPASFPFTRNTFNKEQGKRSVSPHGFPLARSGSFVSRSTTPKHNSRSTTPDPALGRQRYLSESRKSASMRIHDEKDKPKEKDMERHPSNSKGKRLLKALLSRRKSKKDDTLYTYLDEY